MRVRALRALWARWRACAALLAAAAALAVRVRVSEQYGDTLGGLAPAALAHHLADFNNHLLIDSRIESWWVEEESGNYTWWQYTVRYSCGPRCAGRAALSAHELPPAGAAGAAPRHGPPAPAAPHRLALADTRCEPPPLLPWPQLCEELDTETVVSGDGRGGSRVRERASVRCGALRALSGACGAALRAQRERHWRAVRAQLGAAPTHYGS